MGSQITNEQKRRVAWALLSHASALVEFWDEQRALYDCEDIAADDAAALFASWLKRVPGETWPNNLPL